MSLKDTYNRIAEDWFKDHQKDTWWIEGTDKFVSFLEPGSLVLDAGCGGGVKSKYLIRKGLKIIGIDFSEKMIKIAKKEVSDGRFLVLDIQDVEKLEEEFDGIFMQAVLLHILKKDVVDVLRKSITKLRKNGYLYIAVKEKKQGELEEEIKTEEDYGYRYERFFSYFTSDEIKNFLEALKMEIVYESITSSSGTRWIQVIGKK